MARIIENTEEKGYDRIAPLNSNPATVGGAVTKAAVEIGETVGAKFLITFTETGGSVRRMSRQRPRLPMLAFTSEQKVRSQLALVWGIETYLVLAHVAHRPVRHAGRPQPHPRGSGHRGRPGRHRRGLAPGIPGSTNALRVHRVGDAVNRAAPAYQPEDVTR